MNRPIFLTRAQRLRHSVGRVLSIIVVLGLFAGIGLLLGYEVAR